MLRNIATVTTSAVSDEANVFVFAYITISRIKDRNRNQKKKPVPEPVNSKRLGTLTGNFISNITKKAVTLIILIIQRELLSVSV